MRCFRTVVVVFTPLRTRLRYDVLSPLFCVRTNTPVRNRGTYPYGDVVWLHVFGSKRAVDDIARRGRAIQRTLRLSSLWYEPCDVATSPPSAISTFRHHQYAAQASCRKPSSTRRTRG